MRTTELDESLRATEIEPSGPGVREIETALTSLPACPSPKIQVIMRRIKLQLLVKAIHNGDQSSIRALCGALGIVVDPRHARPDLNRSQRLS